MPDGASAPSESASDGEENETEQPAEEQSYADWLRQTADEAMAQRRRVADARSGGATATVPGERRHGISRVPTPWGVAPQGRAERSHHQLRL